MRRGRSPGRGALVIAAVLPFLPLAANSLGWILNEVGRQPWIVQGEQLTANAVSPSTGAMVAITLVGFTLLYGVLAVVEVSLIVRRAGADLTADDAGDADRPMSFSY